jgi:peptidoglycan/LPS O-acetylase OafA/YrhL
MKIRLVRLYPLYLLGSAFGFFPILLSAALNGHLPFSWTPLSLGITAAFNLLFLPAPPGVGPTEQLFPFTDPAWSLLFELLVNLLFAVFWWRLSTGFLYVVCAIGALCIVATSVMTGSLDQGVLWPEFLGALGRVMFSFPLGVLIYRKTRGLKPSKISPLPWFLVAVILFWLPMSASAREIFEPFVVLFVLPLMVTHCALSKSPTSAVAVLSFLGFVSYPIYVLHRPLFFLAEGEVNNLFHVSLHDYAPLSGVLFLCVMMAGSWLAGVVFDSPVRSWATRLVFPGKVRTLPYPG